MTLRSGVGIGVLALGLSFVAAPSAAASPAAPCVQWPVTTVASGFGLLENLAFDGRGSMILSETAPFGPGALRTLTADGDRGVLVSDVASPGGVVRDGNTVYFTTGNGAISGLVGTTDGTIDAVDLDTGVRSRFASGLTMPNGLVQTASGDLLTTRNLGFTQGVTRISTGGTVSSLRTDIGSSNGIGAGNGKVYVANTFEPELTITVFDDTDLSGSISRTPVEGFGPLTASDDLSVGPDGMIYLAQNLAGRVVRIDPESGASCVIASGVPLASSVDFGGPGFDPNALYATSFDGSVRKIGPK